MDKQYALEAIGIDMFTTPEATIVAVISSPGIAPMFFQGAITADDLGQVQVDGIADTRTMRRKGEESKSDYELRVVTFGDGLFIFRPESGNSKHRLGGEFTPVLTLNTQNFKIRVTGDPAQGNAMLHLVLVGLAPEPPQAFYS